MLKYLSIFLLMVLVANSFAQETPMETGNMAFDSITSDASRYMGIVGEPYHSSVEKTSNGAEFHIGFPYGFIYTPDALKATYSLQKATTAIL